MKRTVKNLDGAQGRRRDAALALSARDSEGVKPCPYVTPRRYAMVGADAPTNPLHPPSDCYGRLRRPSPWEGRSDRALWQGMAACHVRIES